MAGVRGEAGHDRRVQAAARRLGRGRGAAVRVVAAVLEAASVEEAQPGVAEATSGQLW